MRTNNYIKERKITLSLLNMICEYLYINKVKITTKMSNNDVILFDETLNSKLFNEWFKSKIQFHKNIDFRNANKLTKHLYYNSSTKINQQLGLRIIKSLNSLIDKGRYSDFQKKINVIIQSDKDTLEKITELRTIKPFKKPKETTNQDISIETEEEYVVEIEEEYVVEIDPYENFHWGGLSGEEANTAYWNCD